MENLTGGLEVMLIFIALSTPIIVVGIVFYFKKKLDHKEILAAIEKGMPLSELKPAKTRKSGPGWIQDLTKGIACLIIGVGLIPMVLMLTGSVAEAVGQISQGVFATFWILPLVFLGNGIGQIISGVLRRKHEKENIDSQQDIGLNS